jgi:hypothetical protein
MEKYPYQLVIMEKFVSRTPLEIYLGTNMLQFSKEIPGG